MQTLAGRQALRWRNRLSYLSKCGEAWDALCTPHVCVSKTVRLVQRAREIVRINFGAEQINELLGGGLESKAITEMFGEYRCSSAM